MREVKCKREKGNKEGPDKCVCVCGERGVRKISEKKKERL